MNMDQEKLSKMIDNCLEELRCAHQGECQSDRAERTAALFLEVQIQLADYLSQVELKAKGTKNEVERLSSQKYFEFKTDGMTGGQKLSEAALEHSISKDDAICSLKDKLIRAEAEGKKWNYVITMLSNGHIYFRNLSKRESNF